MDDIRALPPFTGFREVVPLGGFSGAMIALLHRADGTTFVRKAARDSSLNAALRNQAKRQDWLRRGLGGAVEVAAVEQEGESEGLYWFDMPYVAARDATTHLIYGSFEEVDRFGARVEALLGELTALPAFKQPAAGKSLCQVVLDKLAEIDARTLGRFAELLGPLALAVPTLLDRAEQPGCAHGDLTLENILVGHDGRMFLIDPIDSPFEHRWMDWTKLFQDYEGRWHLHRARPLPLSVSWRLRQKLIGFARSADPDYGRVHYLLLALTFARILPYTRTAKDVEFVAGRLTCFVDRIRNRDSKDLI